MCWYGLRDPLYKFCDRLNGSTENAGRENDGPSKSRGMKMQYMKMQDMKMQDMKMQDMKMQDVRMWDTTIEGDCLGLLALPLLGASSQRLNLV